MCPHVSVRLNVVPVVVVGWRSPGALSLAAPAAAVAVATARLLEKILPL